VANLNLDVCLDGTEDCFVSVRVLSQTTIPTAQCEVDQDFDIDGNACI